jgi:hypothetical protein
MGVSWFDFGKGEEMLVLRWFAELEGTLSVGARDSDDRDCGFTVAGA